MTEIFLRHRLSGLEASRFVAALLVACFHFSFIFKTLRDVPIFHMAFRAGHSGVEYFFVLSGFIIFFVHRSDIGAPQRLRSFLWKRAVRIYPAYWVVWFALVAMLLFAPALHGHRDMSPPQLVLDALLLPMNGDFVVGQSWSLRHELVFYALFAAAIIDARLGAIVIVAWQVIVLLVGIAFIDGMPQVVRPLFYIYNLGFGMGIATAWLATSRTVSRPGLLVAAGIAVFLAAMVVEWAIGQDMPVEMLPLGNLASPMVYLLSSALIIFGVTQMEMARPFPMAGLLKVLGGSSYILYLIHNIVGSVLVRVFALPPLSGVPDALVFVLMVVVSIGAAVMMHLWIERPVLTMLRRRLLDGAPPRPVRSADPETAAAERR